MPRDLTARPTGMPTPIAHHTSLLIYKLAGWINTELDHVLEAGGLKTRHYSVLSVIQYKGPWSQQEVAQKLRIDKATMVAVVDELERLGLVERRRSQADRRHYQLSVTDAGARTIKKAEHAVAEMEAALFSPLAPPERQELQQLLSALFLPVE